MEEWRKIQGYERYEVSSYGRIKRGEKILSQSIGTTGYFYATIYQEHSKRKKFKTHRLVAIEFIPKIDGRNDVNHIDGNKLNNHVSNLEWSNKKHNAIHAYNTGLAKGKAGIYKDEIIAILKFLKLGHTVRQTANQFSVDVKTIYRIRKKETRPELLASIPQDLFQ